MPVYMCDNDHLSYLAVEAVRKDRRGEQAIAGRVRAELQRAAAFMNDKDWDCLPTADQAHLVFTVLAGANARSLDARYPGADDDMVGHVEFDRAMADRPPAPAVQVIKSVHCYRYQACEFDGFTESLADAICTDIINAAICRLPGYDEAPWGCPDVPEGVSLLSLVRKRS